MRKVDFFVMNLLLAVLVFAGAEYAYATLPEPGGCTPSGGGSCQGGCNGYWRYENNGCFQYAQNPQPPEVCLTGTAGCSTCTCEPVNKNTSTNCTCK